MEISQLNVFVGPNGSGKTSLLRVIQFLGDAAGSGLPIVNGSKAALDQIEHGGQPMKQNGAFPIEMRPTRSRSLSDRARQRAVHEKAAHAAPIDFGLFVGDARHHEEVIHNSMVGQSSDAGQGASLPLTQ